MKEKKNPIAAILAVVPGVINTVASLVKDKKKDTAAEPKETDFVHEAIDKGVQLSSKRVMNIVGTGIIVSFAIADMTANGINKLNVIVLAVGVVYSAGMALITYLSEKGK